jgi:hypothetical protein
MDENISYKMCAVKVRNAKLRNYLKLLVVVGRMKVISKPQIRTRPNIKSYSIYLQASASPCPCISHFLDWKYNSNPIRLDFKYFYI